MMLRNGVVAFRSAQGPSERPETYSHDHARHELVFRHADKLYRTSYSVGATENQDETPWELNDQVRAVEVREIQVSATDYQEVNG